MLTAAALAPTRARRRRRILALGTAATSLAAAGAYLAVHQAPAPDEPTLAMLEATSLSPHVVVFSVPLAHKTKDNSDGSGSKDDDKKSDKKDSTSKAPDSETSDSQSSEKNDSKKKGSDASVPAAGATAPSSTGWPTGSTTSPATSGAGIRSTSGGWGNVGSTNGAAPTLPPGIKASVPTSVPAVPGSSGSGSSGSVSSGSAGQVPCTSRVSDMAALQKAVSDAGNSSAVICMNSPATTSTQGPTSGSAPAASTYNPGPANTAPSLSTGSSLADPSTPVSSPSGYIAPAARTATPAPVRAAQMLRQVPCPSSMSAGSVCFEATDSNGAAASLPPASELNRLPVVPTPGSNDVACPVQRRNNNTTTTRTTHNGTTTIENTSTGSGTAHDTDSTNSGTTNSEATNSGSGSGSESTVASCGLLASSVTPSSEGGSS